MLFFVKLDEILRDFFMRRPIFKVHLPFLSATKIHQRQFRPRRTKSAKK